MLDIVKQFRAVSDWITRSDDDRVDRLNSIYTSLLLVVFTLVIATKSWVTNPLVCWGPKHFTKLNVIYTNAYCWVKPMYYLPFDEEILKEHEEENRDYITYYPWMPFILLGQAFFFYLPSAVWHSLNQQAGIDADDILRGAAEFNDYDKIKEKPDLKKWTAIHFDIFLGRKQNINNSNKSKRKR